MPAQPNYADSNSVHHPHPNDIHHPRMSDWRKNPWPINEILLETLVLSGRKDADIAAIWNVDADDVRKLRRTYGV